jgi:predicted DNA-binding transcriptional regulator AlpA
MEKLLTSKQVADRLNMHPKTLYRALRENTIGLNYIQISPRRFGFRPSDVEQYLTDREIHRTGDSPKKKRKPTQLKTGGTGKGREFSYFTDKEAQTILWAQVRKPQTVFDRTEPI